MSAITRLLRSVWHALRSTSRTKQLDRLSPEQQATYLAHRHRSEG